MQSGENDYPHSEMPVNFCYFFCNVRQIRSAAALDGAEKPNCTVLIAAGICNAHRLFAAVNAGNGFFSC